MTTGEYAFDVDLVAVIRVSAASEAEAREAMEAVVNGMEPTKAWTEAPNLAKVSVTEISLAPCEEPYPIFQLDGRTLNEPQ